VFSGSKLKENPSFLVFYTHQHKSNIQFEWWKRGFKIGLLANSNNLDFKLTFGFGGII